MILNSRDEFIMVLANIGHVHFSMVNSKHWYCRCLLIEIYRPPRIVFTFHANLSDEKLREIKRTFLFFWNRKPLVTCNKMNHKFTYSVIRKGIINIFSFCSRKKFFRLVKTAFGLVDVSYSLPKGQAVKLTFFAPYRLPNICRRILLSKKRILLSPMPNEHPVLVY